MGKPRFSIAVLLIAISVVAGSLTLYRWLNPPPVQPLPTYYQGATTERYSYAFGSTFITKITDEALADAPKWDRRNPHPPLSANKAMTIAERYRLRLIKDGKLGDDDDGDWSLMAAELTPHSEPAGQWFWLIHFEFVEQIAGAPSTLHLAVMMNGKVIEPTIERDESPRTLP